MKSRANRMMLVAMISAAALGALAGCGDDDDDGTTTEATTPTEATTTTPAEDSVQQAVDGAVSSCSDSAAEIEGEAARTTAETACQAVGQQLNGEVASLSESARQNVDTALKELSAKCRTQAADFPQAVQPTILAACDQIAAAG